MVRRALWMGLFLAATATACEPDDTTLTVQVQSRVNRALGPDSNVDVSVRGGVAILSGIASGEESRLRAETVAREVDGVRQVRDEITLPGTTQTTSTNVPTRSAPSP